MDKEVVVHLYNYTIEYYLVIKRNTSELVLMRWMNLEPITHSEINQKEKNRYPTLMHMYVYIERWY